MDKAKFSLNKKNTKIRPKTPLSNKRQASIKSLKSNKINSNNNIHLSYYFYHFVHLVLFYFVLHLLLY